MDRQQASSKSYSEVKKKLEIHVTQTGSWKPAYGNQQIFLLSARP